MLPELNCDILARLNTTKIANKVVQLHKKRYVG